MSDDLWASASDDAEAEARAIKLEAAKHAASGPWAFLAQAASPQEYADRIALASDTITAIAGTFDVPLEPLLKTFDQRFALLMEAKDNPFAKDSQDDSDDDSKDSKDDNGDGKDDDSDDDQDSDDTGDGDDEDDSDDDSDKGDGADDVDDQTDKDDDGDTDNADNDTKGKDEDPDQNQDEAHGTDQRISPWGARHAHLAARIQAGENPLAWANAPFVPSPARKHAADGADPVTDTNTPQPPDPQDATATPDGSGAPDTGAQGPQTDTAMAPDPSSGPPPGLSGGIASTTKPRQLPESGNDAPGMGMDGITDQFDPDLNGGDIEQGADANLPGEPDTGNDKIAAITAEVHRYNPTLSTDQCRKVAQKVYDTYLSKHAEDVNPLLFGDRGTVGDGPISGPIKNWSPAEMKPPKGLPGGSGGAPKPPGMPGGAGGSGAAGEAAGEAGAGELAAGGGASAAELLPLLAL